MEFWDWLTQKYIDWRGPAIGHDKTITEFAKWVGVSQSLMSQWMKKGGKKPKSQKAVIKLINRFGEEVYDVLGLPRPDKEDNNFDHLPRPLRDRLLKAMNEINTEYLQAGITDSESPEAQVIAVRVLTQYGFDVSKIE